MKTLTQDTTRHRLTSFRATAAALAIAALPALLTGCSDEKSNTPDGEASEVSTEDTGPFSALSRARLKSATGGASMLVPANPPGAATTLLESQDPDSRDALFDGDQLAFWLLRVEADPEESEVTQRIVSTYVTSAFGSTEKTYEVRQFPDDPGVEPQCRASHRGLITRAASGFAVLVCSLDGLTEGHPDWEYWSRVDFTDDLASVDWLRG